MFAAIITWMLQSQGAKAAGVVVGSAAGGSVVSIAVLFGMMDHSVDAKISANNIEIIRLVDMKDKVVSNEVKHVNKDIKEIKELVTITNQRVYELNLKMKGM